jgi:hypothetical protein
VATVSLGRKITIEICGIQLAIGGVLVQNLQRSLRMLSMKEEPLVRVERRENLGATERPPPKA